jgi:hypothetical protein
MPVKYFYYYIPKLIIATGVLLLFLFGLTAGIVVASSATVKSVCAVLVSFLLVMFCFFVKDAIVPAVQNKAVLIVDENGITDVISWGLIKWSNIQAIEAVKVKSQGRSMYTFTEMHIVLKDVKQYDCYNNSWWIRSKVKFLQAYKGVDIVIDIDALKGKVNDVFNDINTSYLHFNNTK